MFDGRRVAVVVAASVLALVLGVSFVWMLLSQGGDHAAPVTSVSSPESAGTEATTAGALDPDQGVPGSPTPVLYVVSVPKHPETGEDVTLGAWSLGVVESVQWWFPDGTTQTGSEVTYAFQEEGLQNVTYEAVVDGVRVQGTHTLRIDPAPVVDAVPVILEGPSEPAGPTPSFTYKVNGNEVRFQSADVPDGANVTWDFGDGRDGEGLEPVHLYAGVTARYNVTMHVRSEEGNWDISHGVPIWVRQDPPSEGDPTTTIAQVAIECTDMVDRVGFRAVLLGDSQRIVAYHWDFGDGGEADGPEQTYKYADPGTYLVVLEAETIDGQILSAARDDCYDGFYAFHVDFDYLVRGYKLFVVPHIKGDNIFDVTYSWDFGNGKGATGQRANVTYYPNDGTYAVTVVATNGDGRTATMTHQVDIYPLPLGVDFTWDINRYDVSFDPTVYNLQELKVVSWQWTFGDGSPFGTIEEPTHEYPMAGNYTVRVDIQAEDGRTAWKEHEITVDLPLPCPKDPGPVPPLDEDVTVVAIIDTGLVPYHWDFLSAFMPQAQANGGDFMDGLPLCHPPWEWVPGYPSPNEFASFKALNLHLDDRRPNQDPDELYELDENEWKKVRPSSPGAVNMYWIPGSKVIGLATWGDTDGYESQAPPNASHGTGAASVAVGNFHGTCPRCLLVMLPPLSLQAHQWAADQDWIDVQSNSWGVSTVGQVCTPGTAVLPPQCQEARDNVYTATNPGYQRTAIERGQAIFFSAGNGVRNTFTVEQKTLYNSFAGPDWIITVGAITPGGASYQGHAKPADVSAPGGSYPSAYGVQTVSGTGMFSGTSNAGPVVAGIYARALDDVRNWFPGPNRGQSGGIILPSGQAGCGSANPACPLADGEIHIYEMMDAFFAGATHTPQGWNGPGGSSNPEEKEFEAEGHGSYWGKMKGPAQQEREMARITGYLSGTWVEDEDPLFMANMDLYMISDSYCRQSLWGEWGGGDYTPSTPLPPSDPNWPTRTWNIETCPMMASSTNPAPPP